MLPAIIKAIQRFGGSTLKKADPTHPQQPSQSAGKTFVKPSWLSQMQPRQTQETAPPSQGKVAPAPIDFSSKPRFVSDFHAVNAASQGTNPDEIDAAIYHRFEDPFKFRKTLEKVMENPHASPESAIYAHKSLYNIPDPEKVFGGFHYGHILNRKDLSDKHRELASLLMADKISTEADLSRSVHYLSKVSGAAIPIIIKKISQSKRMPNKVAALQSLLNNVDLTPQHIESLEQSHPIIAGQPPSDLHLHLARNPKTPPALLEKMYNNPSNGVMGEFALAENPKTPVHIFKQLALHPRTTIRAAVGSNPYAPLEVHTQLMNYDPDPKVREAAALGFNRLFDQQAK